MKSPKVISYKNLPARIPLVPIAVAYLLLDKFKAPGYVWGIVGTILGIIPIVAIIAKAIETPVEIFKDKQP
jgi:hypothetical protein